MIRANYIISHVRQESDEPSPPRVRRHPPAAVGDEPPSSPAASGTSAVALSPDASVKATAPITTTTSPAAASGVNQGLMRNSHPGERPDLLRK